MNNEPSTYIYQLFICEHGPTCITKKILSLIEGLTFFYSLTISMVFSTLDYSFHVLRYAVQKSFQMCDELY